MEKDFTVVDSHIATLIEAIAKLGPDAFSIFENMVMATSQLNWLYFIMAVMYIVMLPSAWYAICKTWVTDAEMQIWPIFLAVAASVMLILAVISLPGSWINAHYPEQDIINSFFKK